MLCLWGKRQTTLEHFPGSWNTTLKTIQKTKVVLSPSKIKMSCFPQSLDTLMKEECVLWCSLKYKASKGNWTISQNSEIWWTLQIGLILLETDVSSLSCFKQKTSHPSNLLTLTVWHRFNLHGFRDLLIATPARAPPAYLRLKQSIHHGGFPQTTLTLGKQQQKHGNEGKGHRVKYTKNFEKVNGKCTGLLYITNFD